MAAPVGDRRVASMDPTRFFLQNLEDRLTQVERRSDQFATAASVIATSSVMALPAANPGTWAFVADEDAWYSASESPAGRLGGGSLAGEGSWERVSGSPPGY